MNKLTPIFIAGAFAITAGLATAQSQINVDNASQGHNMRDPAVLETVVHQPPVHGKRDDKPRAQGDRHHEPEAGGGREER